MTRMKKNEAGKNWVKDGRIGEFEGEFSDYGDRFHVIFKFNNGLGASVIGGLGSYSTDNLPYELAVLRFDKESYKLAYDTPITGDVRGYLSFEEVLEILREINKLNESIKMS